MIADDGGMIIGTADGLMVDDGWCCWRGRSGVAVIAADEDVPWNIRHDYIIIDGGEVYRIFASEDSVIMLEVTLMKSQYCIMSTNEIMYTPLHYIATMAMVLGGGYNTVQTYLLEQHVSGFVKL